MLSLPLSGRYLVVKFLNNNYFFLNAILAIYFPNWSPRYRFIWELPMQLDGSLAQCHPTPFPYCSWVLQIIPHWLSDLSSFVFQLHLSPILCSSESGFVIFILIFQTKLEILHFVCSSNSDAKHLGTIRHAQPRCKMSFWVDSAISQYAYPWAHIGIWVCFRAQLKWLFHLVKLKNIYSIKTLMFWGLINIQIQLNL
jgi:hypothetical protein